MLRARYDRYTLHFRFLARTSRESMMQRDTYFLRLWDDQNPDVVGVGECNLFRGLSADDRPDYEQRLQRLCEEVSELPAWYSVVAGYSSIIFGLETALADLRNGGLRQPFPGAWSRGETSIPINGLVWMGDKQLMADRIREKIESGFRCLKLKIGGIDFNEELELLAMIRRMFSPTDLQLRLDANGAFAPAEALDRLNRLAAYHIHSIEQPIRAGQHQAMADLCRMSPIDIALDEELIGVRDASQKARLLDLIRPQYIILKPALCGGFAHSDQWICEAEKRGIGWWATSALESNIGLNALAQWVSHKVGESAEMRQGLGTGALYTNNIDSPLTLTGDRLRYNPEARWSAIP